MRKDVGKVRMKRTRTDAARKITEMSVVMPDGKAAIFDVMLQNIGSTPMFVAASDHPLFADIRIQNSDIAILQDKIVGLAQDRVQAQGAAENWAPAELLEINCRRSTHELNRSLTITISSEDLQYQRGANLGNRGETSVRNGYDKKIVYQRGPADDFSDVPKMMDHLQKRSLLDPEVKAAFASPLRGQSAEPMTRVIVDHELGEADAKLVLDVMETFTRSLMARLSPDVRALRGQVRPDEIAELMAKTVAQFGGEHE